jgi:hypothetical protein
VQGLSLGTGLFVDVEHSLVERLVCPFNLLDSIIVPIELVPAGLVKLSEILLGLLMLVHDSSYSAGGVGDLEDRLRRGGSIGDLKLGERVFQSEHVDVGRGRHFRKKGDLRNQDYSVRLGRSSTPESW